MSVICFFVCAGFFSLFSPPPLPFSAVFPIVSQLDDKLVLYEYLEKNKTALKTSKRSKLTISAKCLTSMGESVGELINEPSSSRRMQIVHHKKHL